MESFNSHTNGAPALVNSLESPPMTKQTAQQSHPRYTATPLLVAAPLMTTKKEERVHRPLTNGDVKCGRSTPPTGTQPWQGMTRVTCYSEDEPRNHPKWKKPHTEGHTQDAPPSLNVQVSTSLQTEGQSCGCQGWEEA